MASTEKLENANVSKNGVFDCNGGLCNTETSNFQVSEDVEEIVHKMDVEDVEEVIVHEMDTIFEDIDDRLLISRMVSDSVIKGIVSAISQQTTEVIAAKEREVAYLSKDSCSRQCNACDFSDPEREIRGDVEGAVFGTIVQGLRVEHERRVWNADNVLSFIARCKEISSLRLELDSIQKSFASHEVGHLSPQASLDGDIFHRKVVSNHSHHLGGLCDGNGKCEESEMSMPENFEMSKLSHMSKQELYKYFRTEINQMKRDHESTVHQMTEKYYSLKREFLKERDPLKEKGPLAARKDKEFESLRNKLSEVISRLDHILQENEKLSEFCNHSRDTLTSLVSENCRLWELLNSKKLEACYLAMQASDATEKSAQHLVSKENLQILVGRLTSSLEDARLEALIGDEVYKCILREMAAQDKSDNDDSDLKSVIVQEIIGTIYEEAFCGVNTASDSDYGEFSDLMSDLMQQVYSTIFQDVVTDISIELNEFKNKSLKDDESLVYLETKVSNIESDLYMESKENGNLKHQVSILEHIIEDKDKSLYEVTEELHKLVDLRNQQEGLIAKSEEELVLLKEKLVESQNCVDLYMTEVEKLNEAISVVESLLRKSDEAKARFVSALEQQQNDLAFLKAKEREQQKQMESFCYVIDGLSKSIADLEVRTNETIGWHSSRLEHSAFQLRSLVPKANILRRTSLLYKERLEKRCSDLQKAEAEVDVLGDEVDTLLRLLEKIYVALDHYSPIFQHYPGIIEILQLVKRELSGGTVKVL
ncbi:hypothetical protein RND81_06G092400 [Saponaria officinalis]|uniref:WPP domain-associated protein n=1 Tax=Saponaria officinalis TaxID=3572 RepID=A0AAW1K8J9_SAPOF